MYFGNVYKVGGFKKIMKRKVVLHGPSTLTISLPASWIKKFDVRKGDELEIDECGDEIRISTDSSRFEQKQIDIENLQRVGKSYITSSYRQGYDEIDFTYKDNDYLETIHDLINQEITGFEVVRQKDNHCVIKDLTGHNKDEFGVALRRSWLLLLDLSSESLRIVKKGKSKDLKNIRLIDSSINKFTNYCLRILIKRGRYDYKKTPPYYHFVKCIEEIADKYKELCIFCFKHPQKIDKEMFDFFDRTNSYLNSVYELFYKCDYSKIEDLFNKTKFDCKEVSNTNDIVAFYLFFILRDIRNLLSLIIEINI